MENDYLGRTVYDPGEVVVVPFPFTDMSAIKQRPVLILSSKKYNTSSQDIITCGITSNPHDTAFSVVLLKKDMVEGQMVVDSRVKPDKLFTLHQKMVKKKLGKVKDSILKQTYAELQSILKQ